VVGTSQLASSLIPELTLMELVFLHCEYYFPLSFCCNRKLVPVVIHNNGILIHFSQVTGKG
jgi:hypothetical protein